MEEGRVEPSVLSLLICNFPDEFDQSMSYLSCKISPRRYYKENALQNWVNDMDFEGP